MPNVDKLIFALAFAFSLNLANPAFAYLDPGTGSMILQILLGGVAGVLMVGKLYWARCKEIFSKVFKSPSHEAQGKK